MQALRNAALNAPRRARFAHRKPRTLFLRPTTLRSTLRGSLGQMRCRKYALMRRFLLHASAPKLALCNLFGASLRFAPRRGCRRHNDRERLPRWHRTDPSHNDTCGSSAVLGTARRACDLWRDQLQAPRLVRVTIPIYDQTTGTNTCVSTSAGASADAALGRDISACCWERQYDHGYG